MSILIKGMDKPTDCGLCPFEDFGYCNVKGERNTSESGIDADCPLIEVADRKTEPSGYNLLPVEDEPQRCEDCKHYDEKVEAIACERCLDGKYSRFEPKTEPQTMPIKKTMTGTHRERIEYTEAEMVVEDEPQTDCAWK